MIGFLGGNVLLLRSSWCGCPEEVEEEGEEVEVKEGILAKTGKKEGKIWMKHLP